MSYLTLSIAGVPSDSRRAAIDAAVRAAAGSVKWRANPRAGRWYAAIEVPDGTTIELPTQPEDVVYPAAIIAWAVFPAVPQALPPLLEALGGAGRPAGLLACYPCDDGAILEWDPQVCGIDLVAKVVDVELARFASGRTAELLSPLPAGVVAKVASAGMQTPQIAADRVLELLLET